MSASIHAHAYTHTHTHTYTHTYTHILCVHTFVYASMYVPGTVCMFCHTNMQYRARSQEDLRRFHVFTFSRFFRRSGIFCETHLYMYHMNTRLRRCAQFCCRSLLILWYKSRRTKLPRRGKDFWLDFEPKVT